MSTIKAFLRQHSVFSYFVLTFAISWLGALAIIGPTGFPLTWVRFEQLSTSLYLAFVAGPSVAAILLLGILEGRAGLRDLLARLCRWRVGLGWYAVALLPAFVVAATSLGMARLAPEFVPTLFTAEDKTNILLAARFAGVPVGLCEEDGWTGCAVPRLRLRYAGITTGFIVGLMWGAWHFPLFWEADTFAAALPFALLLARLFAWLPALRVLMVWIYDRTRSVLVAILTHASLLVTQLALMTTGLTGTALLTHILVLAAAMWLLVALVIWVNWGQLAHLPLQRQAT
jgi:membrane protease YdiL (CAAX protease family)